MVRLLVVSEQMWPEGSGGTLATHLITELLAERGFDITVVTGTRKPVKTKGVSYILQPFLRFSDKLRLWTLLAQPSLRSWFKGIIRRTDIVYIPRYCYPVISLANDLGRKVVVHLHDYQPISYNATVFHRSHREGFPDNLSDTPVFELCEHASLSRALLGTLLAPLNMVGRICVAEADEIVCVSKRQAEIIGREAPELAEKLSVVYNPLPVIPYLEKNVNGNSFLYLGGSSFVKGVNVLAKASQRLLKHRKAKFILTKMYQSRFKYLFDELDKHFTGAYTMFERLHNYDEVVKLHQACKALIFPSIWEEPLPYALFESMLMGTIPIASRVGGAPEIAEGTFAEKMLFEPGNVDELVNRMESVLSLSQEDLVELGLALRRVTLERFDQEALKKRLVGVFSS